MAAFRDCPDCLAHGLVDAVELGDRELSERTVDSCGLLLRHGQAGVSGNPDADEPTGRLWPRYPSGSAIRE